MKIIFISNRLTPHQIPCCNIFARKHDFLFVETAGEEVTEAGWYADSSKYPYVVPYTQEKVPRQEIMMKIMDADAVIIGSAPDSYIEPRLKAGKLTFKYAERFYKKGITARNCLRIIVGTWLHHGRFQKYPLHMLCASAYTACDCARFGNYTCRMFKWGYFPETKHYTMSQICANKRGEKHSILWAGRFIALKHPEAAIFLAKDLKQDGYCFDMNIIGYGPLEEQMRSLIAELDVADCVHILGRKTPQEVRHHMETSQVFLFTSDYQEGWGAVLNEAMNSACVPVVSHAVGAAHFLVNHNVNGLVYKNGDPADLSACVKALLDDPEKIAEMGINSYKTITNMWCAEIAVSRLTNLIECILRGDDPETLYHDSGPCSPADVIPQDDMYREITSGSRGK